MRAERFTHGLHPLGLLTHLSCVRDRIDFLLFHAESMTQIRACASRKMHGGMFFVVRKSALTRLTPAEYDSGASHAC